MESLNLEVKRVVNNGCTQVGNIVAYYEQHIDVTTGRMEFLHVYFVKKETKQVPLADGTSTEEVQEVPMRADIEYNSNMFRTQILDQENIPQFWEIFWQIYNQLKAE